MEKTYEILVSGHVQGIGYRAFAVRHANKLNIKGSVENLADGKVKVIAIGEEKNIDEFIEKLKKGPTFASVKHIDLQELDDAGFYKDFHIEY